MAKIIYDRKNCIGCSACAAVCPSLFEMDASENQIANLKGAREADGFFELEIDDIECAKEAADLCGAKVISVIL